MGRRWTAAAGRTGRAGPNPGALGRTGRAGPSAAGRQARRIASPCRTSPGSTTRTCRPRSRRARPSGVFARRSASLPNRALNFAQPVWGGSVTSTSAVPIARRVPAGRFGSDRSRSTYSWSPGERPRVALAPREQVDEPGAHHRDLAVGVGRAVGRRAAAARPPVIADEAVLLREPAHGQHLTLVDARASDDHLERPGIPGRGADVRHAGRQLLRGAMSHRPPPYSANRSTAIAASSRPIARLAVAAGLGAFCTWRT